MSKKTMNIVIGAVLVVAAIALFMYFTSRPGPYDAFAACLKEKEVTFYGAFWCPHCQSQKALFGRSASRLPYVECSLPSGQGQTPICVEKKIESYPTWEFKDGKRITGEVSLQALAEASDCTLP